MATTADAAIPHSPTLRGLISFCPICSGGYGVVLTIDENDVIHDVRCDKHSPLTHGYLCFKERQADTSHHRPHRSLRPRKRMTDGSYAEISSDKALDGIVQKLDRVPHQSGKCTMAICIGVAAS